MKFFNCRKKLWLAELCKWWGSIHIIRYGRKTPRRVSVPMLCRLQQWDPSFGRKASRNLTIWDTYRSLRKGTLFAIPKFASRIQLRSFPSAIMAIISELDKVRFNPINEGLGAFRRLFDSTRSEPGFALSSSIVHIVFSIALDASMTQFLGITFVINQRRYQKSFARP